MTAALTANVDPELLVVQAMVEGDVDAFQEFLQRQGKWVRGVVYGVLGDTDRIEDVCQHIWIAVWQQLGTLQEVRHWRTWLYRLAHNAAIDAGRELTRRRKLNQGYKSHIESTRLGNQTSDVFGQEQRQLLMNSLRELSPLYREPFVLRHLENWSYQEISEVMGLPVDTVETRLVRARRQLRQSLKGRL